MNKWLNWTGCDNWFLNRGNVEDVSLFVDPLIKNRCALICAMIQSTNNHVQMQGKYLLII